MMKKLLILESTQQTKHLLDVQEERLAQQQYHIEFHHTFIALTIQQLLNGH